MKNQPQQIPTEINGKYTGDIYDSRSSKYQYLLLETPVSHDFITTFESPEEQMLRQEELEEMWALENQLEHLMWKLIDDNLSQHQIALLHIHKLAILQGETQIWMAEQMGINQSSVVKGMQGNISYCGGVRRRYGGIRKKLEGLIKECALIHKAMKELEDLNTESVRLPHYRCFQHIIGSSLQYQQYLKLSQPDVSVKRNYTKRTI
jgi:hypothetical protein